jgi:hypothetical protein
MERRSRSATILLAAALLAGCAAIGMARLEPGKSTEADVRRALGEPRKVFANADGSRQLAFTTGPEGTQTHMAHLAADGRLLRIEQVLTAETIARISPGSTTAAQLERLIGPPSRITDFPNKRAVAWDYVLQDTWGYIVDFSVMVGRDGVVAEKIHVRRLTGDSSVSK